MKSLALPIVAFVLASSAEAAPQCNPHWKPGGSLPGADVYVSDSTTWDPDGAGPQPELLVVSGLFQRIGDQAMRGLAGFDGQTWREIDPASGGDIYDIRALAVYRGELVCAGNFSTLGGVALNDIARFDGQTWRPLGRGPASGITGSQGFAYVNRLRVVGDRLIVGGYFDLAGGLPVANIAAWDGETGTWQALGEGLSAGLFYEGVWDLTELDGAIVAAGDFTQSGAAPVAGLARFDGAQWQGYPAIENFYPFSAGTRGGKLVAGGAYYDPTSPDPEYLGDTSVYEWDEGTQRWTQLGGSLGTPFFGVQQLVEFRGELYAGGDFLENIFDLDSPGLLRRFDGQDWQLVDGGLGGFMGFSNQVVSLEVHHGSLVACGNFARAGGLGAYNIAAYDSAGWHAFGSGTSSWVTRLVEYQGDVVASGLFDSLEGFPVHKIARWDGAAWTQVGDGSLPSPQLLGTFRGDLVVLQWDAPGLLRRWDGTAWQPFGEGISGGEFGFARCILEYRGKLLAGGSFAFTGFYGEEIAGLAEWDGEHWRAFHGPMTWEIFGVNAMEVYRGKLVVAGGFDSIGGMPVNGIAAWNGHEWETLGTGLLHSEPGVQVFAWDLEKHQDELIATGQFDLVDGVHSRNIARWDGQTWRALEEDGSLTLYGPGETLASIGNDLYVGGYFWVAGGVEVRNIARWDGEAWYALDGGLDSSSFGYVLSIVGFQDELMVGGSFVPPDPERPPFLARWGCH